MSDNVVITPGVGATIHADEYTHATLGSGKTQLVKLVDGTLDSGTAIAAGNGTNGGALRVTIASDSTGQVALAAGTNGIGKLTANSGVDIGDVDVTSCALPTGAATSAKQDTGNTSLSSIDGKITACNTGAVVLAAGSAAIGKLAANSGVDIGDVDVASVSGNVTVVQGTATNLKAEVVGTGTFAVQGTAVGTVADDATTPGAPVMVGGTAKETDGTDPGSVSAEDDITRFITDRNRRQLVNDRHPNSGYASLNHSTAQTDHELVAAPGANLSLYITDIVVSNGATAGTVLFEIDTAGAKTIVQDVMYFAATGGTVINYRNPIRCTPNKNFGFTSASVTTHTVSCTYYIAP